MKECKDIKKLLETYLDGELSSEENARLKQHLLGCPFCRRDLEDARRIREALSQIPQDKAPDDFLDHLHRRMKEKRRLDSVLKHILNNPAVNVPAALVLVLICFVAVFRSLDVNAPLEKMSRPKPEVSYKVSLPEDTAGVPRSAAPEMGAALKDRVPGNVSVPGAEDSGSVASGGSEQDTMLFEKKEEPAPLALSREDFAAESREKEPVALPAAGRTAPSAGEMKEAGREEIKEAEEIPEAPLLYSRQRVEISVNDLPQAIDDTLNLLEKLDIAIIVPTDKELRQLDAGTYAFVEFIVRGEGFRMKSFLDGIEAAGIGKITREVSGDLSKYQTVVLQVNITTTPSP